MNGIFLELPESCCKLIKYCDMFWSVGTINKEDVLQGIQEAVDAKLLSIEYILQMYESISDCRPKLLREIADICSEIIKRFKPQNLNAIFTKFNLLREILIMRGHIAGFVPAQYISMPEDEIFEIYPKNSFERTLFKDDIDLLHQLCSTPGFDFNFKLDNTTMIDMSAKYGSLKCFKYLLMNNARISFTTLEDSFIGNNYEILHICERSNQVTSLCMLNAIQYYHNETVNYLQTKYKLEYPWRATLMNYNFPAFFNKLLNTDDVNSLDNQGNNPLHITARTGLIAILEYLLSKGAEINMKDGRGNTALMCASCYNKIEMIEKLIEKGAKLEEKGANGMTALIHAAAAYKDEAVATLLKHGANIEAKDEYSRNALICSAMNGCIPVCSTLLKNGADTESTDHQNWTALMIASHYNRVEVVKLLIQYNANKEHADYQNLTSLVIACETNNFEVCKLLVENGANIEACGINQMTPLLIASSNNYIEIMQILLEKNVNIEFCDRNSRTALLYAAMNNHVEAVKLLLEKNANVNAVDNDGYNAIYYATQNGNNEIISLLKSKL